MSRQCFRIVTLTALLGVPGCSNPEVPLGDPQYAVVTDLLPADVVDVDLLFVIDDSGSMAEEQASLAAWAQDALFGVLEVEEGTPLNLHIAVVSTDVGAGPYDISGCQVDGDDGVFNTEPATTACPMPTDGIKAIRLTLNAMFAAMKAVSPSRPTSSTNSENNSSR